MMMVMIVMIYDRQDYAVMENIRSSRPNSRLYLLFDDGRSFGNETSVERKTSL